MITIVSLYQIGGGGGRVHCVRCWVSITHSEFDYLGLVVDKGDTPSTPAGAVVVVATEVRQTSEKKLKKMRSSDIAAAS